MQITAGVYVDSFKLKRPNSTYFLTHWHADHYWGLTPNWQYGPIYCSSVTKKIMMTKYPKLNDITTGLQLGKTYELQSPLGAKYQVTMFDSNHIAGSVIILFKINDKYTLHTGDMRFNPYCLQTNKQLFHKDENTGQYKCNYQIDTLYIDNTYCDPIFMFPNRSDAIKMIKDIIDQYQPGSRNVYLVTDSIGKQEAFVALSMAYSVPVTLWPERMNYVKQMYPESIVSKLFCAKKQASSKKSWIQVIKRRYVEKTLQQDQRAIVIKLTGWANIHHSYPLSDRNYIVPYSLHSNYQEQQLFMSVIRPKKLFPVVKQNNDNKSSKFRQNIHSYNSYFGSLAHMKQRGFNFFCSHYVSVGFTKQGRGSSISKNRNEIPQVKEKEQQNLQQNQYEQYQNKTNHRISQGSQRQMIKSGRKQVQMQLQQSEGDYEQE